MRFVLFETTLGEELGLEQMFEQILEQKTHSYVVQRHLQVRGGSFERLPVHLRVRVCVCACVRAGVWRGG